MSLSQIAVTLAGISLIGVLPERWSSNEGERPRLAGAGCGTSSCQDMTFGPGRRGVAPGSIKGSTR